MEATLTSSTRSEAEMVEAVIVSGPRRGEFVYLDAQTLEIMRDPQLSPEEEAAFDLVVEAARKAADSAVSLGEETRSMRDAFDHNLQSNRENANGLHGQSR